MLESKSTTDSPKVGDRMKGYESQLAYKIDQDAFWMVRLDGHGFSKFTRGFKKPYDKRIHLAMLYTSADLLDKFPSASAVYTESDEISLCFPSPLWTCDERIAREKPEETEKRRLRMLAQNHVWSYSGKIQKIASLMAGFCSVRFNHYLSQQVKDTPKLQKKISNAYFDARIFQLPSAEEFLNNLRWRAKDAARNSKSQYGRLYFSAKKLHAINSDQVVQMVLEKHGADYYKETPAWYRGGVLLKKMSVQMKGVNQKTNEQVEFVRRFSFVANWLDVDKDRHGENEELTKMVAVKDLAHMGDMSAMKKVFTRVWPDSVRGIPSIVKLVENDSNQSVASSSTTTTTTMNDDDDD